MSDIKVFRSMVNWLGRHCKWQTYCASRDGNYQATLFGNGSIAAEHYSNAYALSQKYDNHLYTLILKAEAAQRNLDCVIREISEYVESRHQ